MIDPQAQRLYEFLLSSDSSSQDCAAVQDVLDYYVDLHLAGRRMDVLMPGVALHLDQCAACRDVYEALTDVARLEAQDALPSVAELWPGLLGGAAATAIARATSPANVVPVPPRSALPTAPGNPGRQPVLRRLGAHWRSRSWLPAMAGAAVVVMAFGLWQARPAPRGDEGLVAALSEAEDVRFAQAPGGAWAKVFFGPGSHTALVFVGGLPAPRPGRTRIHCWLKGTDGSRQLAGVFRRESADRDWWTLDIEQPLQDYAAMALTWADDEIARTLVEIPLVASR